MADRVAEIKAQGVQELARDPNSNVTSDDVQNVIVNESKKAGVPAFRFDPNATPEEKAAQAKASIPAGIKRDKEHGLAVATDVNTGPDAYDLPPATAAAAITPATPVKGSHGTVRMDRSEKETFEKKTGWAPRFGQGSLTAEEANMSMLDHQDFLEGKLDEKLFGDWYHNSAIIIFACLSSWVVAVLGGGLGWIFIVMAICSTYYRTSIRRVRRNIKDDIRRELAMSKLDRGTESLEWMNGFLYRFWPIYQPILAQTVINSVDQVLSTTTPAFLDSMRLKSFTLGSKAPRLEFVRFDPHSGDDEVLMDWKFSFTPNDDSDLTARQKKEKVQPKVVLEVRIGKGIVSKGLDVIVEDFAFSGELRVKVKLQLPFPHVEKIDICFRGRPEIDYVCKPLGGDTLGFDINFVPGLESFIKEMIHSNLEPIMYDPHVFPIEVAKILAGSPVDQAIGVVAVTIHGAQGLKNPDNFAGNPDAYIVASLNSRTPLGKTKTVKDTPNPRFAETIYVIVTSLTDNLTLQVFDWNEFRKDKDLGTASFPLEQLAQVTDVENQQLEVIASGNKKRGVVQADIRYFPVLEGLTLENGTKEPPPESNTGIARVTIEQAKDLDGKAIMGKITPYAILMLNGKPIHTTDKKKKTNQPIWIDNAKDFLVTDRRTARVGLVVKDSRDLGEDPVIGRFQITLEKMLKNMEEGKEWYELSDTPLGRIKLLLQWKPVGLRDVAGVGGGYMTPIGVMRLHFHNAKDLRNVETMGKSDPYVRVLLSGIEKGRTVTHQNNLNPEFDEVIYIPVHSKREHLTLEVMDYQNIGKDRSLGLFELPAADYIHEGSKIGEYLVRDEKKKIISGPLKMLGKGTAKGTLNFTAAFYPTIPTIDPEEELADKKELEALNANGHARSDSKSSIASRTRSPTVGSVAASPRKSIESVGRPSLEGRTSSVEAGKINSTLTKQLQNAENKEAGLGEVGEVSKIRVTADNLTKYESGLLVFRLISGDFSVSDSMRLEVIMDDFSYPSFVSTKIKSKQMTFGETGDAIVREIDLSRITVRLVEKHDKDGSSEKDVIAKLSGDLLPVLQRCLYTESELSLVHDGQGGKVKVLMKYLPINMQLDPSESMNNMGTLRVDVLDAQNLPAADKNGFSDPYCKFELGGETVHKTKTVKKTLNPQWQNESFEIPITSRTAARFKVKVLDWDQFGDDDFLGEAGINLEVLDPMSAKEVRLTLDGTKGPAGVIRLRLLFKAAYVTRTRQGSSTFSGSIGTAGKVVGAPVKVVGKVGSGVGGGLVKGATFMKHSFKGSRDTTNTTRDSIDTYGTVEPDTPLPTIETPKRFDSLTNGGNGITGSPSPRAPSIGGSMLGGAQGGSGAETGTANIAVLSATGYPSGTKIQVTVKAVGSKSKKLLETKPQKCSSPESNLTWDNESTKHNCTPDTQFQVIVEDHGLFGGKDLGEAVFFIDDSAPGGSEKSVKVGAGTVVLKSAFTRSEGSIHGSTAAATASDGASLKAHRKSFLSRSRGTTPS